MDKEALKAAVCGAIDAAKADIEKLALCIESEPELGFKETKTAKKVEDYMRSLGLDPQTGLALTGVKSRSGSSYRSGPHLRPFPPDFCHAGGLHRYHQIRRHEGTGR